MSATPPDPAGSGSGAAAPDLWSFSLDVYARPGVAAACLTAQDRHGQDVNLLLWALWLGWVHGHQLSAGELAEAHAAVAAWATEVVLPLRSLRRRLKGGPSPAPCPATDALRSRIKAAELEAERLEQVLILAGLPAIRRPVTPRAEAAAANLALLLPDAPSVTDDLQSALRTVG